MLIRFRVENYRSFLDVQEFSFVASSLKDMKGALVPARGFDRGLLRVAAIYGANASGKTNVLRALKFMCDAVFRSQKSWGPEQAIPRDPFLLDKESEKTPSLFEVDLLLSGSRFRYGFRLDSIRILDEWLYAYTKGRKQKWFTRQDTSQFAFGKSLPGANRVIENLTRRNSLFLSAAAQNNHEVLLPVYRWFTEGVSFLTRDRSGEEQFTADLCRDEKQKSAVWQLLTAADLGLVSFDTTEEQLPQELKKVLEAVRTALPEAPEFKFPETIPRIRFRHKGQGEFATEFPRRNESDGTLAYLKMLGSVVMAIESGLTLCVDELDMSLHPLLSVELVRLFNDPGRNPKGAQLIFTTHDTHLLDRSLLRRDQVWFTEKDGTGRTHLYPLTDFKPRKNENLKQGYLQGRYGAVPFIGPTDIAAIFEGNGA